MKKVVIAQYRLLHYRTALFQRLKEKCLRSGIDLHLVHGQPTARERLKSDTGVLPWADVVTNRYVAVGDRDWLWQPIPAALREADLTVLMQESRLLSNYPHIFLPRSGRGRVAFWGHGRNFQSSSPAGWREQWKRFCLGRVDWWFAYTSITQDILVSDGYPRSQITVLDNAIDNDGFVRDLESVDAQTIAMLRAELALSSETLVGLFCGSLYPYKRIDLMVSAVERVRETLPDFRLIVIGDGPSGLELRNLAATRPWLVMVGVQRGVDKAKYFKIADVVLNPGLVGLHVLDAFCAGLPMVTTSDAKHSPEIAYLRHEVNGLVSGGTVADYAKAVTELLTNPKKMVGLKKAAFEDSQRYTLDNMVANFHDGITKCLEEPAR